MPFWMCQAYILEKYFKLHYGLPTKVCLVKAVVFPVVMYRCECWTIKKAEHRRIDAFWTMVLERTPESPLDCKKIFGGKNILKDPKGNQYILKEISPENSLEGLMLKLKLQYFGHLMRRTDLFEKTLMLGKVEGGRRRGWDGWMASLTQRTWVWVNYRSWRRTGRPGVLHSSG